ncbi:MAG TPA: hypothetical protein VHQ90_00180 [Thermoanaerobaculia bacterium]|nr:hypothetical protein [Thermoanaerobaculia bacterium]
MSESLFGGSPVIGRDGQVVGDQLDMTTLADDAPPARARRRQTVPRPRCRRMGPDGGCPGELIARQGMHWICARCGLKQPAGVVRGRP